MIFKSTKVDERMKKPRVHMGNRYGVMAWVPSEQLRRIAHERTEGLVGYFQSCASRVDAMQWQEALHVLARSCYMQGLHDMADAAARRFSISERHEAGQRDAEA